MKIAIPVHVSECIIVHVMAHCCTARYKDNMCITLMSACLACTQQAADILFLLVCSHHE